MKKTIHLFILVLTFSSCFMSKTVRLAKKGHVEQKQFDKEFDFEYILDLIVIEVSVNGQPYHFVFDSGAFMSVIDEKVMAGMELDIKSKTKANSSSGISEKKKVVLVDEFKIEGIQFQDISTFVMDLSGLQKAFGCKQIDGLIGNNLMRKANWQIDYQNKKIRMTSDMANLKVAEKAYSYKLNPKKWGNTMLPIEIDGVERYFTFDTGFGGFVQSNQKMLDRIQKKNPNIKTTAIGNELGFDLFGGYTASSKRAWAESLVIGDYKLPNRVVSFKQNASSLIGNMFFDNFKLTINSDQHRLYLDPNLDFKPDSLYVFELKFAPDYDSLSVTVTAEWTEHKLEKTIPVGTQVLKMEGLDIAHFTKDELCQFWDVTWTDLRKKESITIETEAGENVLTKKLLLGQ